MENGWIKLHRKILESEVASYDGQTFAAFVTLLLRVNFRQGWFQGMPVLPGQMITSREKLAAMWGVSVQRARTILHRLELADAITVKSTNRFTLVSVCNWETYQNGVAADQPASNQPATSQQPQYKKNKKGRS